MDFVRVVWTDASDPPSNKVWFNDDEVEEFANDEVTFESFGYVVSKTKLYLTLAADLQLSGGEEMSKGRLTKIPVGMVKEVTVIPLPPLPATLLEPPQSPPATP